MAKDLTVTLDDRPGGLADLAKAIGKAGINMLGGCGVTAGGQGIIHILVEDADTARAAVEGAGLQVEAEQEVLVTAIADEVGELGRVTRTLADAGVNLTVLYLATNTRLVVGADDIGKAKEALA